MVAPAQQKDTRLIVEEESKRSASSSLSNHEDPRTGADNHVIFKDDTRNGLNSDSSASSSCVLSMDPHCPNLSDTAKLGLELSMQKWADINSSGCSNLRSIEHIAQRIHALFLIRILALLSKRERGRGRGSSWNHNLPHFSDLSTTCICHAILAQECRQKDDTAKEEKGKEHVEVLEWPGIMTKEVFSQLYQYIYQILQMYHLVSYHNREHAYHVFISAHKLLDMVLSEYDYSHGGSSPVKKQTRVTYGLKSDPLVHLAYLFSALVHDVDHTGVSNRQLVMESDELAIMYNDQSVAEQRSLAIAFRLLMTKDFQTLRQVIFENDGDYMMFRKIVIDLVLCTDIASPERVQIVKSKWKEAFGDKSHASLSPMHRTSSSCFEGVPFCGQRMNEHRNLMENDSKSAATQTKSPNLSPATGVSPVESKQEHMVDASVLTDPLVDVSRENSLTPAQKKKRNAWKSEPADDSLRNPSKLRLVYYFFAHRGSMMTGKRFQSRNSRNSEDTLLKKEKKSFLRSFKRSAKKPKQSAKEDGNGMDTAEKQKNEVVSDTLSNIPLSVRPKDKGQRVMDRTNIDAKEEIEKIQNILSEYEEDLSVCSEFSEFSSNSPRENNEVTPRRRSEDVSKLLSICKQEFDEVSLNDKQCRSNSIATCSTTASPAQYPSQRQPKTSRRFTEPPNPFLDRDRKRFHLRLGICRALDLPGNQINEYKDKSTTLVENDPDHPNELKMIVVLEQMMKAADVAANMQGWETMICWSNRLFQELKASHEDGRGNDPVTEWHENQIAFFESYTMPLACRLVETGVFEFHEVQELVNGVRQNNIRWMIEGRLVFDRMIREWEMLEKTDNSRKRALSNVGF